MAYFRRLYLHSSVMDMRLRDALLGCLFLALKVEECYRDPQYIVSALQLQGPTAGGASEATVTESEPRILDGIRFQLQVFHPSGPIKALLDAFAATTVGSSSSVPATATATATTAAAAAMMLRRC